MEILEYIETHKKEIDERNRILSEATKAIEDHPYSFLYTPEVRRAFEMIGKETPPEAGTAKHSFPAYMVKDKEKLFLLPLHVILEQEQGQKVISVDWFIPGDSKAGDFLYELLKALDELPESKIPSAEEVDQIKQKYPMDALIRVHPKDDYLKPGIYKIRRVDDIGQIHVKESGIAVIPDIDEIEILNYQCWQCGKKYDGDPIYFVANKHVTLCEDCANRYDPEKGLFMTEE